MDILDEIVICKDCGNKCPWGEMVWLNGSEHCPVCYVKLRDAEDARRKKDESTK
jgi:hypothetical protein